MISLEDNTNLEVSGHSAEQVTEQLQRFRTGFAPASLNRPAVLNDGILRVENRAPFIDAYEQYKGHVIKFVPASGAATRMFKHLFSFMRNSGAQVPSDVSDFFENLSSFAFSEELDQVSRQKFGSAAAELCQEKKYTELLELLLSEEGMNYGDLPKGLIKFHQYDNKEARTPIQEHIEEGLQYADAGKGLELHFTVLPSHRSLFEEHMDKLLLEERYKSCDIRVSYSYQKKETDTVAVTLSNELFRNGAGELLFRPAGHGALLENLNEIDADLVFVKNIDNVVPDRLRPATVEYKKLIAGVLLSCQEKAFDLLKKHDAGQSIFDEGVKLLSEMGIQGSFADEAQVVSKLNRPIRVCGMVKNEGEPGGGPFWVNGASGNASLQIVESAQVNKADEEQSEIFSVSTHFNPVDIVCAVKNYKGEKFDLLKYRDPETGFISEKSHEGQSIRAMELPGLWNGSMSDWNTVFVEVPLETFNPVKTVNDLLREQHQNRF